jgi:hypothetical protein
MAGVSTYTVEVGDAICERIAEGESLRKICQDDDMPSKTTVFRWLEDNEVFRDQYARAREWQAETLMEEALEIADDRHNDVQQIEIAPGTKIDRVDYEVIQRSKLRVEARLKLMGQLAPKKYGPKMSLSVKEENPIQSLTDEELLDELRKLAPKQ